MIILAIDPGSSETGCASYDTDTRLPIAGATVDNVTLAEALDLRGDGEMVSLTDVIVWERMMPRGQRAYEQTMRTLEWTGVLMDRAGILPTEAVSVTREEVKQHLLGKRAGTDADVNAALRSRYGGPKAARGTKANPGPLYGITGDALAALAVAITYAETRMGVES